MAKVAGILGKKVGMTQLFDSKGDVRPATVLQAGPCVVTQHKSQTSDGYDSAQLGLVEFVKESRLTQPMKGHLGKNNLPPVKFIREVPIEVEDKAEGNGAVKAGDRVLVDIFDGEKFVDIVGVSKGRDFRAWSSAIILAAALSRTGRCFRLPVPLARRRFPRACSRGCACRGIWAMRG